ncbi:helix-turn-helix domain-containing protein [Sorangium sp. So ce726]|uniref:helix-turn-helix domain-containing protein n=1 Tax=Sorangium sp. So ce726 TaxID=3133319 RepID=UPI003F619457
MTELWSSVDEVAKHLGVAQDSIYGCLEGQCLPAHKIGRFWTFKWSEIDAWVRAGCAKSGEKPASKTMTAKAKRRRS